MNFPAFDFFFSNSPTDDDRGGRGGVLPGDSVSHGESVPVEPIVERLRAGDESALREVWELHYGSLVRFATRYMQSADAAADVVQQVFVTLWERRALLAPHHTLSAHLFGAVRFRALHELRQERTRERAHIHAGQDTEAGAQVANNEGALNLDLSGLSDSIVAVLNTLSPRVRGIFLMHRVDGLTAPQIAALLGINTQVVYNQLSKAVRALAVGLKELK